MDNNLSTGLLTQTTLHPTILMKRLSFLIRAVLSRTEMNPDLTLRDSAAGELQPRPESDHP